jgi:hypothetical protein
MLKKELVMTVEIMFLILIILQPTSAGCSKRNTVETIISKINDIENLHYTEVKEALNILLHDVSRVKSKDLPENLCSVAQILISISNDFQTIDDLTKTGSLENHKKALEIAQKIEENIDLLREKSQNKLLAELPEFSLKTFYEEEAKLFENYAVNENVTAEKLELLSLSRQCYKKCNDLKSYARVDFELKKITSVYEKDMNTARELYKKAKENYENALQSDVIHAYMMLKDAKGLIDSSYVLYKKHGEVPKDVISLKVSIEDKLKELSKDFMINIAIYCVVLFSIMLVLLRRLGTWMEDVKDTKLGKELSEY